MADVPTSGLSYPQRFALAIFADGSAVLDLETGAFFRVNAAAAQVFTYLREGASASEAASRLALSFGITAAAAAGDVNALLAQLPAHCASAPSSPITFRPDPNGLVLEWNSQSLWQISHDGLDLTYVAESLASVPEPASQLLWAAPHVLALRGTLVLHASAVQDGDRVLAFCGGSGRGKTTLARMLAAAGMGLVAEDLLVIRFRAGVPEAVLGGEGVIRAWAAAHAAEVAAGTQVSTEGLWRALEGAGFPLGGVAFPRRDEASGAQITHTPLGPAEAFMLLLENSFAEMRRRDVWQRLWESHQQLARQVPARIAHVPEGLELLRRAAASYSLTVKS